MISVVAMSQNAMDAMAGLVAAPGPLGRSPEDLGPCAQWRTRKHHVWPPSELVGP